MNVTFNIYLSMYLNNRSWKIWTTLFNAKLKLFIGCPHACMLVLLLYLIAYNLLHIRVYKYGCILKIMSASQIMLFTGERI